MIPAARAVRVEVLHVDAVLDQILPRRAVLLDRTCRRDVIRRDAVTQDRKHAAARDVLQRGRLHRDGLEERRIADVCRVLLPREAIALRHAEPLPVRVALEDIGVLRLELFGLYRREHRLLNLTLGRPDVA